MICDEFRFIDENTDLSNIKPYNWDLVVKGRPYYVTPVEGYIHRYVGRGEPIDLWCWPRDEQPSHENMIEYDIPESVAWGLEYKVNNYVKCKWDETELRQHGYTVITRNGEDFYTVAGGMAYSVPKAMMLIAEIKDHPLDFGVIDFDKKMVGRKIWYHGQPAVIRRFVKGQCCIIIEPEGAERFTTPLEYQGDSLCGGWEEEKNLKIDCLRDGAVNWFRY